MQVTLSFPTDEQKAEIRADYITAKSFLDDAITAWPGMNATQKQTWLVNNFDAVLKINRAVLVLIKTLLE